MLLQFSWRNQLLWVKHGKITFLNVHIFNPTGQILVTSHSFESAAGVGERHTDTLKKSMVAAPSCCVTIRAVICYWPSLDQSFSISDPVGGPFVPRPPICFEMAMTGRVTLLLPTKAIMRISLSRLTTLFRVSSLIQNYIQPEKSILTRVPFWLQVLKLHPSLLLHYKRTLGVQLHFCRLKTQCSYISTPNELSKIITHTFRAWASDSFA
jgi:hypothetical protein